MRRVPCLWFDLFRAPSGRGGGRVGPSRTAVAAFFFVMDVGLTLVSGEAVVVCAGVLAVVEKGRTV